jgi:hypothetical protein
MARIRLDDVDGRPFLTFDLSGVQDDAEALAEVARVRPMVRSAAPKSLRVLTIVTGSRPSLALVRALRDLASENDPYVYRSAVVGLGVVHRAALQQIVEVADRDIREFASEEAAMAWLSE